MNNSFYIITIHNKEHLLHNVLSGILKSSKTSKNKINIVCVFDGCTDNSEHVVDEFCKNLNDNYKIHKIYENDVHELLSLNSAIRYINTLKTTPEDIIYMLQDDVVLDGDSLDELVDNLYSTHEKLGYISFRCGLSTSLDKNGILCEHSFVESTYGHWKQLNLNHFRELLDGEFLFSDIVIKSPTCIKKRVLDDVGFFDEKLAPFGHDDLDLCIRLINMGYKNAVFGFKFNSDVDWGGTRETQNQNKDYHKNYNSIVFRNKLYLTYKHKDYYETK